MSATRDQFEAANDPMYEDTTTATQPVYNVYRGQGACVLMTYRVIPGESMLQFYAGLYGWQHSQVSEKDIRDSFPLVAKNVRFKA